MGLRRKPSIDRSLHIRGRTRDPINVDRSTSKRKRRRRLLIESLGQRRVLAVITGHIFHDVDGSLRPESQEVSLGSRLAFIDENLNGEFDADERFAVADADGQFRFEDLDDGTYSVRLFDGSRSQVQTFPTEASQSEVSIAGGQRATVDDSSLFVLTDDSLFVQTELTGLTSQPLPFSPLSFASLDRATFGESGALVSGTSRGSDSQEYGGLWLVNPESDSVTPIQINTDFRSVVVGADGFGLALTTNGNSSRVSSLSVVNDNGASVQLASTSAVVPADTSVLGPEGGGITSAVASRSVFAWSDADGASAGLQLSLWNNGQANWIQGSSRAVPGASELLSFDDTGGLVAVRYDSETVGVLDVEAGFAPLHQFSADGPAKLVPGMEAIVTVSSSESGHELALYDLRRGGELLRHKLDDESVGNPRTLAVGDSFDEIYVIGDSGVAKLQLDRAGAHTAVIRGGSAGTNGGISAINGDQGAAINSADRSVHVEFGVAPTSAINTPPTVRRVFAFDAVEDSEQTIEPQDLRNFVHDLDGDRFVPLIVEDAANGEARVRADGSLTYVPDPDFAGEDFFSVLFHDGQNPSPAMTFAVSVAGTPDAPSGISLSDYELPEHSEAGYEIGAISVKDADESNNYLFSISDDRFDVADGMLVFVGGYIDHEFEPQIPLTVTGDDISADAFFSQDLIIAVTDENDPVAYLINDSGEVYENDPGAFISELSAYDEDSPSQTITFSVDDHRFEVVDDELKLKENESLDYEAEPLVVLTITADDGAGGALEAEFRVTVIDVAEAPGGSITLSKESVMEWEPGATVGDVQLSGVSSTGYELSVDDPRFEIDGSTLKLVDEVWVRRSDAEQIQLTISASSSESLGDLSGTFVIEVLENDTPFHNDDNPYDVNGDDNVSPSDALAIINYLNVYGPGPVGPGDPGYGYDVNADGQVSAIDALIIINYLNTIAGGGQVGGESTDGDKAGNGGGQSPVGLGNANGNANDNADVNSDHSADDQAAVGPFQPINDVPIGSQPVDTSSSNPSGSSIESLLSKEADSNAEGERPLELESAILLIQRN